MLGLHVTCRVARGLERGGENVRGFEFRAEHLALVFWKVVGLRAVAEVVDGDAAAEVDVFERVARFVVDGLQVFPHRLERGGERLNVGRLRADVYVYAGDVQVFGRAQREAEGFEDFRRGDAKLRGHQRGLESEVRARADLRHESERDAGALAQGART